ncbi:FAD-dependent monooxygenase [Oceanibium sediminis]|uniref:FAD-dependent monooxygenase n=1 Tax=Oceanibium sediminis TaxID=2026339 RepID=UPI000DD32BC2|nr:FAD-dependent monooxygenase [Oceanibium sediminis]
MERTHSDILVAGGGIAGMIATACFAAAGFETTCIEPQAQAPDEGAADADLRSTAFLEPAIALLKAAGVWERLSPHATDLRIMRLADAGGETNEMREVADFDASTLGQARFGVNLPNVQIRKVLLEHLDTLPGATLLTGRKVVRATARTREMILTLDDGTQHATPLAVAADGRNSFLRQNAGIKARRWDYGQQALVFAVSHPVPHDNVSTEIHRTGGPFTLVPLPDRGGVPHSAVVWMETGPKAAALAALPAEDFNRAATERSCGILGPLELATGRGRWPISSLIAERLDGPRVALVAEAAHVMPPIGAQGLNTSLGDLSDLLGLVAAARDAGQDHGAHQILARYSKGRHGETLARVLGVDALNRAAMAESQGLRDLRRAGLKLLYGLRPLREGAMRAGLGAGRLPDPGA